MKHAQIAFSIVAAVVATLALGFMVAEMPHANGAPQQAALAAMILAVVVPFYVIARCVEMITSGRNS